MAVALGDFLFCVERFVVFIGQADRFAYLVDDILIGRRRRTAGRLFADVGALPVGVNVARRVGR